jgi:predicted RNA-binding protein with RPS1 domain
MAHEWMQEIRTRFPDWQTSDALARWTENKARLKVGQQVSGTVIARAPFGVWLDIDAGHPALLLVTEMATLPSQPIPFADYPAIGAPVMATIVALGDKAEIGLSQFPDGSSWSKHRTQSS